MDWSRDASTDRTHGRTWRGVLGRPRTPERLPHFFILADSGRYWCSVSLIVGLLPTLSPCSEHAGLSGDDKRYSGDRRSGALAGRGSDGGLCRRGSVHHACRVI